MDRHRSIAGKKMVDCMSKEQKKPEEKTIVIHQPDFMPYLGFFDRLLHAENQSPRGLYGLLLRPALFHYGAELSH